MKHEYGFEIDFNKISYDNVCKFLSILYDLDYSKDSDFIVWNILGNYIYWCDGEVNSFYICKSYVNIKGFPRYMDKDLIKAIGYLKEFM